MIYTLPKNVIAPQDCLKLIRVIYDGGLDDVSVAMLDWNGRCIGMRWNNSSKERNDPDKASGAKICRGMPVSSGHPVWFILPDWMFEDGSELSKKLKAAVRELNENTSRADFS